MTCHAPGLIVAHMRSGPLKAYHVVGQITAQIRSGPLRGFGLNYGTYQIRPVNWTLCFWAHLLNAHLVIRSHVSSGLLRARLTFRPYINFGLLKARHIVGLTTARFASGLLATDIGLGQTRNETILAC